MKKFQGHGVTLQGQGGIVSRSFVAQESVLSIELVPGEVEVFLAERVVDFLPTFERYVRVLGPQNISSSPLISPALASVSSPDLESVAVWRSVA